MNETNTGSRGVASLTKGRGNERAHLVQNDSHEGSRQSFGSSCGVALLRQEKKRRRRESQLRNASRHFRFLSTTYLPTLNPLSKYPRAHRDDRAGLPKTTVRSSLGRRQSRSVSEQAHHGNRRADLGVVGAGRRQRAKKSQRETRRSSKRRGEWRGKRSTNKSR